MRRPNGKKIYIFFLSFFSGLSVMAVELCAARVIAPYFGAYTFVWANIIGVVMVALAVGYLWGGRLADRHPDLNFLLRIMMCACGILLLVSFLAFWFEGELLHFMLLSFHSVFFFIFFGSLAASIVLFFVPVLLLGMTSPFLIKLLSQDDHVGNAAGLVFGISTLGGVLGTYLPVLVFIPTLGTAKTILLFTTLLLLVVFWGLFRRGYLLIVTVIMIAPAFVFFSPTIRASPPSENKISETESSYQYIQVADQGNLRYLIYDNGSDIETTYNKNGILTGYYCDFYSLLPYMIGGRNEKILIIGLAGGTIADQLKYFFPDAHIDGVEIDPKAVVIGRRYFDLDPGINVITQDGRIFLEQTNNTYDLIIVDAYVNQSYIPFYLTTKEFFALAKDHLTGHGLLAMNVSASGEDPPLLGAITNTLNATFDNTYLLRDSDDGSNYLVFASKQDVDLNGLSNVHNELSTLAQYSMRNIKAVSFDGRFLTLTDDKAPIEYLTGLTP